MTGFVYNTFNILVQMLCAYARGCVVKVVYYGAELHWPETVGFVYNGDALDMPVVSILVNKFFLNGFLFIKLYI